MTAAVSLVPMSAVDPPIQQKTDTPVTGRDEGLAFLKTTVKYVHKKGKLRVNKSFSTLSEKVLSVCIIVSPTAPSSLLKEACQCPQSRCLPSAESVSPQDVRCLQNDPP